MASNNTPNLYLVHSSDGKRTILVHAESYREAGELWEGDEQVTLQVDLLLGGTYQFTGSPVILAEVDGAVATAGVIGTHFFVYVPDGKTPTADGRVIDASKCKDNKYASYVFVEPPYAIGSGAHYALGALGAGVDAPTAVEVAKRYDLYSGGQTQTLKLF